MESKHVCEVMKGTRIEKKEKINNGVGSLESEVTPLVFLVEERKQKKNSLV